jgi:hypothetical protein
LRFSRLFWPAKPSSLPQLWRNAKKRRKKKKKQEDPTTPITPSFKIHDEYESDDEVENLTARFIVWGQDAVEGFFLRMALLLGKRTGWKRFFSRGCP